MFERTGLAKSRGEARRTIEQGGVYVNNQRQSGDRPLTTDDVIRAAAQAASLAPDDPALIEAADAADQMRTLTMLGEAEAAMQEVRGYGLEHEEEGQVNQRRVP